MLTKLRKYGFLKVFLWLVIISFLATIFIVWGVGDKQNEYPYVAKVGNKIISFKEYVNIEQEAEYLNELYGGTQDMVVLKKELLNSRINAKLLAIGAKKMGLVVSDKELASYIKDMVKTYTPSGEFDLDAYKNVLRANGFTVKEFEEGAKESLYSTMARNIIESSVAVTDDEVKNEYIYQNTAIKLSYLILNSNKYKKDIKPTADDISNFFNDNKELYRVPQSVKVKVYEFDPKQMNYELNITDEDLKLEYEKNISSYITPVTLNISEIFLKVSDWNNATEIADVNKKIEDIKSAIKKGDKFSNIAKKYSDDSEVKTTGGELGDIQVPLYPSNSANEQIVYSLKEGEVTDPLKFDDGYYIYKANSRTERYVTPFEDIRDSLRDTVERNSFETAYTNYIYAIYKEILKAGSISAFIDQNQGVGKIYDTEYIYEDDKSAFFQQDSNLKQEIFSMRTRDITSLFESEDGKFIYELVDKQESYIPNLSDVYTQVEADYIDMYSMIKAVDTAENILKVKSNNVTNEDFKTIAKDLDLSIINMPSFKRIEGNPRQLWAQNLENILFSMKDSEIIVYPVDTEGVVYIIRVDNITSPNTDDIKDSQDKIRNELLDIKKAEALNSYLEKLRNEVKIQINPNFE